MCGSYLEAISILKRISAERLKLAESIRVDSADFNVAWGQYQAIEAAIKAIDEAHTHELNEMAKYYEQKSRICEDQGLPEGYEPMPDPMEGYEE